MITFFYLIEIMKIWSLSALMGCDVSKSTDVIENEEIESETFDFTDTQIDTIRSTWPILANDMADIGTKVFLKIFLVEPKLKYTFPLFRYYCQYFCLLLKFKQERNIWSRKSGTAFLSVVISYSYNLTNKTCISLWHTHLK